MVIEVLLFNKCAARCDAARVHADSCPMVAAARHSRGRVAVIEGEAVAPEVKDLIARQWPVKRCKCLGPAK